jgi:hypothetical protein
MFETEYCCMFGELLNCQSALMTHLFSCSATQIPESWSFCTIVQAVVKLAGSANDTVNDFFVTLSISSSAFFCRWWAVWRCIWGHMATTQQNCSCQNTEGKNDRVFRLHSFPTGHTKLIREEFTVLEPRTRAMGETFKWLKSNWGLNRLLFMSWLVCKRMFTMNPMKLATFSN